MLRAIYLIVLLHVYAASCSAQVTYDPVQGIYHVAYVGFGDSVHVTALLPGNRAKPSVSAAVDVADTLGRLRYEYELGNQSDALAGLGTFLVPSASVDSSGVPSGTAWEFVYTSTEAGGTALWVQNSHTDNDIAPGDSLGGFLMVSSGLPAIISARASALHHISYDDEGPSGAIRREVDSLFQATQGVALLTIGPRDPSTPFDLGDFLDTLATYPLRAAARGWIADSTAGDLDGLLGDAVTALGSGDSTWAATLLATVRNHVEAVSDDSLSSEGYALMKYNIDYALGYLPAVVKVKVFLEGAYVSGTLKQQILNSIPKMQPFGDTLDTWHYYGEETLTRVPQFTADWVLVSAVSADTMLVGQSVSLLDEDGVATVAFEGSMPDSAYLVVDHRNHIAVMSDTTVDMTGYYAEHDFTTGHAYGRDLGQHPQKIVATTPDTVYAMWAGDGNADGQATVLDFGPWLAATTSGATGYQATDYNMDTYVTVLDFSKWIANTTLGAATGLSDDLADLLLPRASAPITPSGPSVQSLGEGPGAYVRLNVIKDDPHRFWVDIQARADATSLPLNTLASFVADVFYDETELTLDSTAVGVLDLASGYGNDIKSLDKDGHPFIRVTCTARSQGSPWHDLDTDWEVIQTLYFARNPPKHDPGASIRPRTLGLDFYDVHSNANGSNQVHEAIIEIQ